MNAQDKIKKLQHALCEQEMAAFECGKVQAALRTLGMTDAANVIYDLMKTSRETIELTLILVRYVEEKEQ